MRVLNGSWLACLYYSLGHTTSFCGCTRGHYVVLESFSGKVLFFFFFFFWFLVIPQFWLLCHISSLRLSSWHSSPVLTVRTSLPRPHLQMADMNIWATYPLVVVVRRVFSVCVCVCVCVCSCLFYPLKFQSSHRHACESVSYCVEMSPSWLLPQDGSPSLNFLSLFVFYIFPTSFSKGFPGGLEVKESASNAGDPGSIPGLGRSPGEENGNALQYSCLKNSMDREAW